MSNHSLTVLQQKEVEEVLIQFGLSPKEILVYLSLLANGHTTITPLARSIQLPTTTVQSILERLGNIGVISITKHKSRHHYEASSPKILQQILEEKIKSVNNIIPLLENIHTDSARTTKIKIYYRERLTDIFNEALTAKNKIIYEIVSADDLQTILGEKFHFTRRRKEKNIQLKSLRVETHEIKRYSVRTHRAELREAKFLPRELTFSANVLFWDNTLAIFSAAREGLAWTVESPSIREMFAQIFNLLWQISRPMETLKE